MTSVAAVAIGLVLAIVVMNFELVNFLFHPLVTIIHELGHTATGWLFGYPSIPAFDFQYGGGVTMSAEDQSMGGLVFVYFLAALALYHFRRNRSTVKVLVAGVAVHAVLAFTRLHEILALYMGHGFELVFVAVFFYRALTGAAVKEQLERPLYAFVAFYMWFGAIVFGYQLSTSVFHRTMYEEAKGGGHWMDFSRIAEEYLHTSLESVAGLFLLTCLIPPVVALVLAANRERWHDYLWSLAASE